MKVGLYARVSTKNKDQDPEMQLRELREYVKQRGWTVVEEFVDHGFSGAKDSRPALDRMMTAAKQRKLDCILVWKLDRFGRSLKHLVTAISELQSIGVAFVSLKDSFDLSTPSGRLLFSVVGAMAEFERDLIRERVIAGLANRKAKGLRVGRKPVVVDVARLHTMRSAGLSVRQIAEALGCSKSAVHQTLSNLTNQAA